MSAPSIYEQARAFSNLTMAPLDHNRYLTASDDERIQMWVEESEQRPSRIELEDTRDNLVYEWDHHCEKIVEQLDTIHDNMELALKALYELIVPSGEPSAEIRAKIKALTEGLDMLSKASYDLAQDPT